MKLHLFHYECKNCGNIFKSPELLGNSYGEFLLNTKTGNIAYLNAIDSNIFSEFSTFLKHNDKVINLDASTRAKILHHIFGISCDNAADGSVYGIMQKPPCPECGKVKIGHWGPTNPAEIVDMEIRDVTHERWSKLTEAEKQLEINEAVEKILADKNIF